MTEATIYLILLLLASAGGLLGIILFIYDIIFVITIPKHLKSISKSLEDIAKVIDEKI